MVYGNPNTCTIKCARMCGQPTLYTCLSSTRSQSLFTTPVQARTSKGSKLIMSYYACSISSLINQTFTSIPPFHRAGGGNGLETLASIYNSVCMQFSILVTYLLLQKKPHAGSTEWLELLDRCSWERPPKKNSTGYPPVFHKSG